VTFGLGSGQGVGQDANSSEETAHSIECVHVSPLSSAQACPADLPNDSRAIDADEKVVIPCKSRGDIERDPIADMLAAALLRALNAGDFATYTRVKDKLDDWQRQRP
jgi:hypothetical protein